MKLYLSVNILLLSLFSLSQVPSGSGMVFNGVSDYYTVNDNSSIDLSGSFTIEAWINPCDTSGLRSIATKLWCTGGQYSFYFCVNNGKLRWNWDPDGFCSSSVYNLYESVMPIIRNNVWQHVAVVHTPVSITLYYNGLPVAGTLVNGSYSGILSNSNEPLRIGAYRWNSGSLGGFFNGRMDELRIWDSALTPSQVSSRFNSPLLGTETGLQLYHNFESVSGANITNSCLSTGLINNGSNVVGAALVMLNNASYPIKFNLGNDTTLCQPNTLPLSIPNSYSSFTWSDGFLSRNRTIGNSGTYIGIGYKDFCFAKDTISISIINCDTSIDTVIPPARIDTCVEKFVMPNVFSPNGDNINDVLRPVSYDCFNLIEFLVYNRWGQLVFKSREKIEWDGNTLNNSTVTDGTYFWVVSHQNESGHKVSESGFVSVFN